MSDIMLVIGSVTAKQYDSVRFELMRSGLKPKIIRLDPSKFSFGIYRSAQFAAIEDQAANPEIRRKLDLVEELQHERGVTREQLQEEGDDENDPIEGIYVDASDWFEAVFVEETGHTLDEVQGIVFEADFLDREEKEYRGDDDMSFKEALLTVDVRINALKTIYSVDTDGTLERI